MSFLILCAVIILNRTATQKRAVHQSDLQRWHDAVAMIADRLGPQPPNLLESFRLEVASYGLDVEVVESRTNSPRDPFAASFAASHIGSGSGASEHSTLSSARKGPNVAVLRRSVRELRGATSGNHGDEYSLRSPQLRRRSVRNGGGGVGASTMIDMLRLSRNSAGSSRSSGSEAGGTWGLAPDLIANERSISAEMRAPNSSTSSRRGSIGTTGSDADDDSGSR